MIPSKRILGWGIRPVSRMLSTSSQTDFSQLMTIDDVWEKLREYVGVRQRFKYPPNDPNVPDFPPEIIVPQSELPPRRPRDSHVSCYIPMSDPKERLPYLRHGGGIRIGRFLEDMDILAGVICYKHDKKPYLKENEKSPYAFMTVIVDHIEHIQGQPPLTDEKDIYINGQVTWVGTSSVECTMNIEQEVRGRVERVISAQYMMVARNPATNSAGVVNPLAPETQEEVELFNIAEEKRYRRREKEKMSLLKAPPTEEERLIVHDMFLSTIDIKDWSLKKRTKPENSVWMKDTSLQSVVNCYPEDGSVYNKIFGGFVMMKAFELASTTTSVFCRGSPGICRSIKDIMFMRSVEIGDVLHLGAKVVYTRGSDVQVYVRGEVINPQKGTFEITNDFHFTFDTGIPNLPTVVPLYYSEAMMYLTGRRFLKD